jgi:hypothetical protein
MADHGSRSAFPKSVPATGGRLTRSLFGLALATVMAAACSDAQAKPKVDKGALEQCNRDWAYCVNNRPNNENSKICDNRYTLCVGRATGQIIDLRGGGAYRPPGSPRPGGTVGKVPGGGVYRPPSAPPTGVSIGKVPVGGVYSPPGGGQLRRGR